MKLQFRPHHFLCTLGFRGKGYSPEFVDGFQRIKDSLEDDSMIEVVEVTDSICAPCPHKIDHLCEKQQAIESLDQRHQGALELKTGQKLSWAEAKKKMSKNISIETFHKICEGCQWKELGVCEDSLNKLHQSYS